MVLCVDEKSECQALERTQSSLPLGLGYVQGFTHDYVRHGTTTLFAAPDIANERVLTQCKPRHRHREFLSFLLLIERNVPEELEVCLAVDKYGSHKHATIKGWRVAVGSTSISRPNHEFVERQNEGSTLFMRHATANSILEKLSRLCQAISGTER